MFAVGEPFELYDFVDRSDISRSVGLHIWLFKVLFLDFINKKLDKDFLCQH